jgi:hypothetical protein
MKAATHLQAGARRVAVVAVAATFLAAALLCVGAATPSAAPAATVSGVLKGAIGYKVLLVQANGKARKATIRTSAGSFSITGGKPAGATLQLVRPDGSYYGPIVLKATATKAFAFIKGATGLKLGTVVLKTGYATARRAPRGRYQTLAVYAAKAVNGKPAGAGKLGRVRTGKPMGLRGPGADLDLDGIVSAFDIDDNGNLLLDNVDRSGRGNGRPRAAGAPASAPVPLSSRAGGEPLGPPPLDTTGQFYLFSNFWPTAVGPWTSLPAASINANIAAITDLDTLIDRYLPMALSLAMEAPDGTPAQLDGLDNSYIAAHDVDGVTYPLVGLDYDPPTYATPGVLDLIPDPRHTSGCPLKPGALAAEIGAGDCFVMTTSSGARYPGTLNFAFNTAPALKSYQFDTDAGPTDIVYDTDGVQVRDGRRELGGVQIEVPTAPVKAAKVTLTFWRPQRKAGPGEPASAAGWVDIGGLWYAVNATVPRQSIDDPESGTASVVDAISNAVANGQAVPPAQWDGGILDPAGDRPADPGDTISFTLDLATCYSSWTNLTSGAFFSIGLQAVGGYGDNAATGIWFTLE